MWIYMMFEYESGYFKAILDIYNTLELQDANLKLNSKKKYQTYIYSLLKLLLSDDIIRNKFMRYGGIYDFNNVYIKPSGELFVKEGGENN